MIVDSYRFLPRSFTAMYDGLAPAPGEDQPVWAPFDKRLAEATIALLTSGGLYVEGEQDSFDLDRERNEPLWGDPTHRVIPHSLSSDARVGMAHLHVNSADVLADRNVALPLDVLDQLVDEGRVGAPAESHISVMGYQAAGLADWRESTAPQIIELLRAQRTDGIVLAPV